MSTASLPQPVIPTAGRRDPFYFGWRMVRRARPDGSDYLDQVPLTEWDVLHPQEDDFIVHDDIHWRNVAYLRYAFDITTAGRPGVVVLSDHRVDWEVPGIFPHGPDISVFFGVTGWHGQFGTFPVRRMTATPILVVEVTSPSTWRKDLNEKVDQYHRAGVPLYLIADIVQINDELENSDDPVVHWMIHKSTPDGYVRAFPDESGRYHIEALGVSVGVDGHSVVVFDAEGNRIPNHIELNVQRREALQRVEAETKRADDEKKRADDAVRRTQELEAELRRLRGES